jgi:hypothetical protein
MRGIASSSWGGRQPPLVDVRRRATLALATLVLAALALATRADAYVYWTNYDTGTIGRANLDGTGANPSFITGASNPGGVAVDGAHVYWTYFDTDAIGRANLDGTGANPSFIAAPTSPGSQVAVDDAHVYWVSRFGDPRTPPFGSLIGIPGTGAIGRANLDGTGVDVNFISGISFPAGGVAVDGSHLYWTSYHPDTTAPIDPVLQSPPHPTRIGRANLNGTGVEENFISDSPAREGLAVDEAHLWWALLVPSGLVGPTPSSSYPLIGGIKRANLDGTGAEFVVEPATRCSEAFSTCGIALNDTHVYWTEDTSIGRARLDGSRATHELISTPGSDCHGVAVDALGPPPSNEFRLGNAKRNKKRGSAKLTVNVAGPGELKLAKTKDVKGQRERAEQSGKLKLSVKAKGKTKKRLKKRGKAKVKAKVTYTPDGGASDIKRKNIKLVKR